MLSPLAVAGREVVYPGKIGKVLWLELLLGDAELVGQLADSGSTDAWLSVDHVQKNLDVAAIDALV